MSLATDALRVSREGPEEYKHRREASMATRQAGTTHAALLTGTVTLKLVLTSGNTYQTRYLPPQSSSCSGREGGANESTKELRKGTNLQ